MKRFPAVIALLFLAPLAYATTPTILGTPALVAGGSGSFSGSYAPVSGTANRVVVMFAYTQNGTTTLTSITWNGHTVNATVTTDAIGAGVGIGAVVFPDADLPASSSAITVTWANGLTTLTDVLPVTVDNVNQSTPVRTSNSGWQNSTTPSITLTGLISGDLLIGQAVELAPIYMTSWQNSLTQIIHTVQSGGGNYDDAAYKTAASTSEVFGENLSSSNGVSFAAIGLEPSSGGASCTHDGFTSGGTLAVPNGTSGSYRLKNGSFGTPDCSTVSYFQPTVGNFGTN